MNGQDRTKMLARLSRVIEQVEVVMASTYGSPDFERWHGDAVAAIRHAFGPNSHRLSRFDEIKFTPIILSPSTDEDWAESLQSGLQRAKGQLESMVNEVEEYWPAGESAAVDRHQPDERISRKRSCSTVFLVHGRNEAVKSTVARFLEQLDLEPVILAEQPSGGRTIIEKVEAHANVGYAIALLTPDDVGSRLGDDAVQPRARQNVIFELGYFIGRLGRERVCALTKGQPEIPSDYAGVVYIPMESDAWKMGLFKELKAAGFDMDANKVFG